MTNKVGTNEFASAVSKLLRDYKIDVQGKVNAAIPKISYATRARLKKTSPRGTIKLTKRKHYADNWWASISKGRLRTTGIVHNRAPTYRVAHLLEYGHAMRNGGRARAFVHIAPAEAKAVQDLVKEIEKAV